MINRNIFENLFVLEVGSAHRGDVDRAIKIIFEHSQVVRFNGIRAAVKLQFRDVNSFIHKDFVTRTDIPYIKRIMDRNLQKHEFKQVVDYIRNRSCIPMSTPFDEESVSWCEEFDLPIIKIASADCNDWMLIERISKSRRPVIVSVGGVSLKDLDDMVSFFERRDIPLAINHCVAAYPHEDYECELNQIDFLRNRYPGHTIGYSCHEYRDWETSMLISYAKGARTWERHIDINSDGITPDKHCSLPEHIDRWFKAYKRAKEFSGITSETKAPALPRELAYLDTHIRGVYAKREIPEGKNLEQDDIYLAVPLQKGQLSTRELILTPIGYRLTKTCPADAPLMIDMIDSPYARNDELIELIYSRGF